jgi:hypothetical protein
MNGMRYNLTELNGVRYNLTELNGVRYKLTELNGVRYNLTQHPVGRRLFWTEHCKFRFHKGMEIS